MPAPKDIVYETSESEGSGNFTLTLVNGRVRFSDATDGFGTGVIADVFDYYILSRSEREWERGTGHMSDENTLVRDTVTASSNGNALVDFSAGIKDVTNDIPAANRYYVGGTDVAVSDGGTGASTAAGARTNLDVDQAGTDNSTDVTLAGSLDYITLSGQQITRNAIDLTTDVSGTLPVGNLSTTGADTSVATGTAGTDGDLAQWNVDGDLVDGPTPPSGTIVGTTDAQTLTNKTLTDPTFNNDLLINSGGIVDFDSGDVTLTHSSNLLVFDGGNLALDGGHHLLLGTTAVHEHRSDEDFAVDPKVIVSETNSEALIGVCAFTTAASTRAGRLSLARSRGTSINSWDAVQDNDTLGVLLFEGADGNELIIGASITGRVDGTVGDDDLPSELIFGTTPSGDYQPTYRWRMSPSGHLEPMADATYNIGSSSLGINDLYFGNGGIINSGEAIIVDINTALTNTIQPALELRHGTSGTEANNIGVGVDFTQETTAGDHTGMRVAAVAADVSSGAEDFDCVVSLMEGGAAFAERLRLTSAGRLGVGGAGVSSPLAQLHIDQDDASGNAACIYADQADVSEPFIHFNTTIGTGNAIEAIGAKTLTTTHFIKIEIPGGLVRYIPCGTIA